MEISYLHVAAESGNDQLVGLIVNEYHRELFNKKNDRGDTALHLASRAGHLIVVDILVRCGMEGFDDATTNKNHEGNMPLHEALIHKHQHVVDLLLGFHVQYALYVNNNGKSGLYLCVEDGNVETVKTILSYNGYISGAGWLDKILEKQLIKGNSLIHAAISARNIAILQEIMAKGLHMLLHVKDENGQYPIEFAASIGFEEGENYLRNELDATIIEINAGGVDEGFLQHSPVVMHSTGAGVPEIVLQEAPQSGDGITRDDRMRKLLETCSIQKFPEDKFYGCMDLELYEVVKSGNVDDFIDALEKNSQETNSSLSTIFNQVTPLRNTFLHVTSTFGNKDLSEFITHYFPNLLNKRNCKGDTALHLAVREKHYAVVEIFVNLRNVSLLPTEINIEGNDRTRALVHKFPELFAENNEGNTPLQEALLFKASWSSEITEVEQYMIKENIEAAYYVNSKGISAFYIAVLHGRKQHVKLMMSTPSRYVDQSILHDQLTKGKSLILAAIWSKKIELLQELAQGIPALFDVKDEHEQKLVKFAEVLGFHEGANYLCTVFKLEILLGNDALDMIPTSPRPTRSLDAFSLAVIGVVDLKLESIIQSTHQNGRDVRMKKLVGTNSLLDERQQYLHNQQMNLELYEAAKTGDIDVFISALEKYLAENKSPLSAIYKQLTPQGNSLLHVAASFGNADLSGFIVYYFREMLTNTNEKRDTALHVAARAGHLGVVETLVKFRNYHQHIKSLIDVREHKEKLRSSSLHEAFRNNHIKVAEYLIKANAEDALYENEEGESGLYLAVEAGMADLVKTILRSKRFDVDKNVLDELTTRKSLLHAAIRRKNIEMLQELARSMPELKCVKDEDGQNPLHYAVSTGFIHGVNYLVDELKMPTSEKDSDGFYPVHLASKGGHVDVLQKLFQLGPGATEYVNHEGQNILHIAAKYGKDNIIRFILSTPGVESLISEKDKEGNTPLHLATINWHPKVVSSLTWDKRVNMKLVNDQGLTALEAAEEDIGTSPAFRKRLTWLALMSAGAPRARSQKFPKTDTLKSDQDNLQEKENSGKDEPNNMDYCRDRVNTLLLVSTLVATVTFAAGFTMPGGSNDDGMATMLHKREFQTFVICNTAAMYSAIMVVVMLIWAQLDDLRLLLNALKLALPLLGFSLTMMSVAFMVGVSVGVSKLTWLASCVLIMGTVSLAVLLVLFIPLFTGQTIKSRIGRYLSYYPFYLLIYASGSCDDDVLQE